MKEFLLWKLPRILLNALIVLMMAWLFWILVGNPLVQQAQEKAKVATGEEDRRLQRETFLRYSSIPPCKWNADCDDGDPCTYDHCKMDWEGTKSCTNKIKGVYEKKRLAVCRITLCDRKTGEEAFTHLIDGAACDAGNYILNGHCNEGVCVGDSVVVCNDNNACTRDSMWKDRCNFLGCKADSYRDGKPCDNNGHCHHGICHDSDPPD